MKHTRLLCVMLAFTVLFPGAAVLADDTDTSKQDADTLKQWSNPGQSTAGNPHVEAIHTAVLNIIETGGTNYDAVGTQTKCDVFLRDLVAELNKKQTLDPNFTQDGTAA